MRLRLYIMLFVSSLRGISHEMEVEKSRRWVLGRSFYFNFHPFLSYWPRGHIFEKNGQNKEQLQN